MEGTVVLYANSYPGYDREEMGARVRASIRNRCSSFAGFVCPAFVWEGVRV